MIVGLLNNGPQIFTADSKFIMSLRTFSNTIYYVNKYAMKQVLILTL